MHLYFVRHTSVDVPKGFCYGQKDVALASSFDDESLVVSSIFKNIKYQKVYSSPSLRCMMLAQKFDKEIISDKRLMELNFGDWELRNWDDIGDPYAHKWMNDYFNLACPNGESFKELLIRFKNFIDEIKHLNQDGIIVTHGGIIRAAYHLFNRIPITELFKLQIDFGSIHKFEV
jgi:alpha-ribazole phosphatase